jgi:maltose/moltooligosaccharide transporter
MDRRNLLGLIAINFGISAYWTVENFWINMYWVREIDPLAMNISIMVSISAITGVLTQIIFGALSDRSKSRFGRRRVYILWGALIGAVSMAVFPSIKGFKSDLFFVLWMAVLFDVLITLFGDMTTPTRVALLTENTTIAERGRINALLSVFGGIGGAIIMGMYFLNIGTNDLFFYVGAIAMGVGGLMAFVLLKDPPQLENPLSFRQCISRILQRDSFIQNRQFYYLLGLLMLCSFGNNIFGNYVYIYAENTLLLSQEEVGLIGIIGAVVSAAITLPLVAFSDRLGRKPITIISLICGSGCLFLFSQLRDANLYILILTICFAMAFLGGMFGTINTWIQDTCPKKMQGSMLAYLIVASVIPMVPGSILGGYLADAFAPSPGIYSPVFFMVASIVIFCALPGFVRVKDTIIRRGTKIEE